MEHPIVLPPHIEIKLIDEAPRFRAGGAARERWLIQRAAQLGADQELVACCEVVSHWYGDWHKDIHLPTMLRTARRPKPLSLKQQAQEALDQLQALHRIAALDCNIDAICRAIESLPDKQD